jgi:hypothetical protein
MNRPGKIINFKQLSFLLIIALSNSFCVNHEMLLLAILHLVDKRKFKV